MKIWHVLLASLAAWMVAGSVQTVRAAENMPAAVVGGHNFIHTVRDLDKTLAFYKQAFGLEPESTPRPAMSVPAIQNLTATPGAKFRVSAVKIPGADFSLEFTQFTDIPRVEGRTNMQDPGNSLLELTVRNIDESFANAVEAGAEVVTTDGRVLRMGAKDADPYSRAVFIRDPDGFLIELLQYYPARSSGAPDDSAVVGGSIGLTAADLSETAQFWRHFGLNVQVGDFQALDAQKNALGATEGALMRVARVTVPGSHFGWTYFQYTDIPRRPYVGRVQDPGTPAVSLEARSTDNAMKAVYDAGAVIVTLGDKPVHLGQSTSGGNLFIRDPNGILFELIIGS